MFTLSEKTTELCKKACADLGYDFDKMVAAYDAFPPKHAASNIAYGLLCACIEYFNKQKDPAWFPDYVKQNDKYYTWHRVKATKEKPSGVGFADSDYCYDDAGAVVAVRLMFCDVETEREAAEALDELYVIYKL